MSEKRTSSASDEAASPPKGLLRKLFAGLFTLWRGVIYLLGIAWVAGAIIYNAPLDDEAGRKVFAIGYVVVIVLTMASMSTKLRRFAFWFLAMGLVIVPWFFIKPSNEGAWRPPWAELASVQIEGDTVNIHKFRNFDYGLDGTTTENWEERTVHLSNLRGLDYFHHDISEGGLLAHPILSFDFGEDGQVAFSVEVRYQEGQKFSPVRGLYKQYTLIYLVGDERDFVRERANVRDEPLRLYRSSYSKERIREMFLETVRTMNSLRDKPRFYHTITANCTTSYISQAPPEKRARLDYRIIFNGRLESLLYERRVIVTEGLSLDELIERATINRAAKAAHTDLNFSAKIRLGRPGFGSAEPATK